MYAVIIGINYAGTSNQLGGCINDAENILLYLKDEHQFVADDDHLIYMTDNTRQKPTYNNILNALEWLCKDRKSGESLFFSFSGHGSRLQDRNGDEKDGKDEVLVPIDFEDEGMFIIDDQIREIIAKLPQDVRLFSICDCCHSGTSFDLKYNYHNHKQNNFSTMRVTQNNYSETNANVIVISGCKDYQTSADTVLPDPVSNQDEYQGALTGTLLSIMREMHIQETKISYKKTIQHLCQKLKENGYAQIPQLTSGRLLNCEDDMRFL
jgi:hypothetical protein